MTQASNRPDFAVIHKGYDNSVRFIVQSYEDMHPESGAVIASGKAPLEALEFFDSAGYDLYEIPIRRRGISSIKSDDGVIELRAIVPEVFTVFLRSDQGKVQEPFKLPDDFVKRGNKYVSTKLFDGENHFLLNFDTGLYVPDTFR